MAIQNVTRQKLTLKKGTVVATVSAANVVPPMLAPKLGMYSDIPKYEGSDYLKGSIPEYARMYLCHPSTTNPSKLELTNEQSNKLLRSLDVSSIESWSEDGQQKAVDLLKEYHHLFALDDLEMGCTSEVKH